MNLELLLNPQNISIIIGAAAGAIRSAVGWLESGDTFNPRLFILSLIRASIIGVTLAMAIPFENPVTLFMSVYFADTIVGKAGTLEQSLRTKKAEKITS